MLGFVIGDRDMITGFRLVGVVGAEVESVEAARQEFSRALLRNDIVFILIGEEFSVKMRNEIDKIRAEQVTPLIVEVPGRNGASGEIKMSDLVSKTLGIKV